jgi:hypothetical protein
MNRRARGVARGMSWVPVDACTLPTAEQPLRAAEFGDLFDCAIRSVERSAPDRLLIAFVPDAEARVREIVARESECCDFFTFDVRPEDTEVVLEITVPPSRLEVLDGLAQRAATACG